MPLAEEFESAGNWLFHRRSWLPLFLFVPLGIAMTRHGLLTHGHRFQGALQLCCLGISLVGVLVRALTVGYAPPGTSGRSTGRLRARQLNTTGMYSVVRHPLYLANFLMWLGLALFCLIWWMVVIFVLSFWLYYERIMFAEEAFLRRKFGQVFVDWAARTPAWVPRLSRWQRPATPLSIRKVLREENPGWLGLVVAFFGLSMAENTVVEKTWSIDPRLATLAGSAVVACLVLRTLKKRSSLLCDRAANCPIIYFSATSTALTPDNCVERSTTDAEGLAESGCRM